MRGESCQGRPQLAFIEDPWQVSPRPQNRDESIAWLQDAIGHGIAATTVTEVSVRLRDEFLEIAGHDAGTQGERYAQEMMTDLWTIVGVDSRPSLLCSTGARMPEALYPGFTAFYSEA